MTTTTLYQYDSNTGEFLHSRPAQTRPNGDAILDVLGATPTAPPADIPAKRVARWTGKKWEIVEDHRQTMDEQGRMVEGTGTQYWLPSEGDDYRSEARYLKELGPLPEGALLSPPEQTLDELKTIKRQAFASAFTALDQRAQRPQSTVLAALMYDTAAPEPDADFIWQLEAIKEENRRLLAQLEAATTREEAEAINPWLPWNSTGSVTV